MAGLATRHAVHGLNAGKARGRDRSYGCRSRGGVRGSGLDREKTWKASTIGLLVDVPVGVFAAVGMVMHVGGVLRFGQLMDVSLLFASVASMFAGMRVVARMRHRFAAPVLVAFAGGYQRLVFQRSQRR